MGEGFKKRMEIDLVLPDTNILILALKKEKPYSSFLRGLIVNKRLILSAVVVAEFLVGATEEQEKIFNLLLTQFKVVSVDLAVAQLAAVYRKKHLEKGKKIGLPDCFIAATCKIHKIVLATLNKKDYPMEDLRILDKFK